MLYRMYIFPDDALNILLVNYWFYQKEAAIVNLGVSRDIEWMPRLLKESNTYFYFI